jgi:hypothetical protein
MILCIVSERDRLIINLLLVLFRQVKLINYRAAFTHDIEAIPLRRRCLIYRQQVAN